MTQEQDNYITFVVHTAKFRTLPTVKYNNRTAWHKKDEGLIYAFIPGNIQKIFVQEGEMVSKGQKLMILDAMKMFNNVLAPFDGVVKKIHITEGVKVTKQQILIELDLV